MDPIDSYIYIKQSPKLSIPMQARPMKHLWVIYIP
jgi:hypothetical protein